VLLIYLAPLSIGELVVRLQRGQLFFVGSFREQNLALLKSAYPASYDELLGYVPRPGFAGTENAWGTTVTIDERGFRRNGQATPTHGSPILALGDSFTFGDQVSDHETWPAHLERRLNVPVWNAGVFGYGLDQVVLRAEQLIEKYGPPVVIVSMIDEDIDRCGFSCRFAEKPFFEVDQGHLVLKNIPVPAPNDSTFKQVMGHSALADELAQRTIPRWWRLTGAGSVQEHDNVLPVAKLLIDRLAEHARLQDVKLLLVIQGRPTGKDEALTSVVSHASSCGLNVLDLRAELNQKLTREPDLVARWFFPHPDPVRNRLWEASPEPDARFEGHMRSEGNTWVAAKVAREVHELGWLDP
jgi:hypothetical protein